MPVTALADFVDDIARARAIIAHADPLPTATDPDRRLRADLLRSAWMFSVGALDAYFCDAYTDLVAATASSKSRQPGIALPIWVHEIKFPLAAVLAEYQNPNWRWRMAARKMMERENVLSLTSIQSLFNKFFRKSHRFFGDLLDGWISHPSAKKRLFAVGRTTYLASSPANKQAARTLALEQMSDRFEEIFQRRHDCIHNCDRPKRVPQPMKEGGTVLKVVEDIEFLVLRCDEHITAEFREFLRGLGCQPATIAQAGY